MLAEFRAVEIQARWTKRDLTYLTRPLRRGFDCDGAWLRLRQRPFAGQRFAEFGSAYHHSRAGL